MDGYRSLIGKYTLMTDRQTDRQTKTDKKQTDRQTVYT